MAFGRKKRKQEEESAPASPEEIVGEPSNGAFPPAQDTPPDEATATAAWPPATSEPEAEPQPATSSPVAGDELSEAAASAGDPAAAGIGTEGSEDPPPGDTATRDAAPSAAPAPAATASPDPFPAGHSGNGSQDATESEDAGPVEQVGAAAAGLESLVEARPEVLVAAAFAAGLVVARVLGAFGGDR